MSDTKKHKDSALYRIGELPIIPQYLRNYWNRVNGEKGYFRSRRKKILEKGIDKTTKLELYEN